MEREGRRWTISIPWAWEPYDKQCQRIKTEK